MHKDSYQPKCDIYAGEPADIWVTVDLLRFPHMLCEHRDIAARNRSSSIEVSRMFLVCSAGVAESHEWKMRLCKHLAIRLFTVHCSRQRFPMAFEEDASEVTRGTAGAEGVVGDE